MSARTAALAFKVWAVQQRLFNAQLGPQDAEERPDLVGTVNAAFDTATQSAKTALFTRRVSLISYNETAEEVHVYLNRGVTKAVEKALPQRINGVRIVYLQGTVGQIGPVPAGMPSAPAYTTASGKYTCGSSIFPGGRTGAGTLGALVTISGHGNKLFGLSNNHVVGQCNYSDLDHPIVAPGSVDIRSGFVDPFTVGHFARSCPMHFGTPDNVPSIDNLDASIFSVKQHLLVSTLQGLSFDTPPTVQPLADNMAVKKVGRTTGLTFGTVTGKLAGPIPVNVAITELGLQSQVYFENAWVIESPKAPFSAPGDSGSLIVTDDEQSSVGLLFAGNGTITLALPLIDILTYFNATLASGMP